jgi:hypothetical protein
MDEANIFHPGRKAANTGTMRFFYRFWSGFQLVMFVLFMQFISVAHLIQQQAGHWN